MTTSIAAATDTLSAPFRDAQIVILGEVHDNPMHHANQARIVYDLQPHALVFEMFGPDKARGLTPDIRDNAIALEAALDWQDSGWPDFAMYYPIFSSAPDAAIFGGALPRETVVTARPCSGWMILCPKISKRRAKPFNSKPIARQCRAT
jgi:uncharacterized iron-regulated protein